MAEHDDAPAAAAAQRPRARATGRPSARRTAASGRPGRGASTTTRCATSRSGWPRSASSAATGSRSSATTGRACTGPRWPRSAWAACSVPVYQDSIAKELAFVWNHAEVSVIVAEDQEQVDKILALRISCPALRLVIYDDPRGMLALPARLAQVATTRCRSSGGEFGAEHPGYFEAEIEKGRPEDVAIICYTSGTTGKPKGAMLTHANVIETAQTRSVKSEDVRPEDDCARVPADGVGGRLASTRSFVSLVVGFCVNCPESPETVQRDLRELGPTTVLAPPRIWENMLTGVQVRAADSPRAQAPDLRALPRRRRARRDSSRRTASPCRSGCGWRLRSASSSSTARARPARPARAKWALTGGAPLGPDTFRFFRSIGVNLKQVYGSTETTGLVSLQPDARGQPDHRRPAVPGHRGQDRRPRRGAGRRAPASSRATSRTTRPPARSSTPTAGSTPATPASSIRAATWSSSTAPRTWARSADGTPFAPQFIENKLKFSPLHPRGGRLRPRARRSSPR